MEASKGKEKKSVFCLGILVFLLISEHFPPSLTIQALLMVMQPLLSSSHTFKGVSLPCAVVFRWTSVRLGPRLVWIKGYCASMR